MQLPHLAKGRVVRNSRSPQQSGREEGRDVSAWILLGRQTERRKVVALSGGESASAGAKNTIRREYIESEASRRKGVEKLQQLLEKSA